MPRGALAQADRSGPARGPERHRPVPAVAAAPSDPPRGAGPTRRSLGRRRSAAARAGRADRPVPAGPAARRRRALRPGAAADRRPGAARGRPAPPAGSRLRARLRGLGAAGRRSLAPSPRGTGRRGADRGGGADPLPADGRRHAEDLPGRSGDGPLRPSLAPAGLRDGAADRDHPGSGRRRGARGRAGGLGLG
eukprot:Nk52_evm1s1195 gene=Nk52_evmTU1s1195